MVRQPGFLNSLVGQVAAFLAGGALALLGSFFSSSTSGMGLVGLGIAGMVAGIFGRPLVYLVRCLAGRRDEVQPGATIAQNRQGDDSLYELNFVRQSLRRDWDD